MSTTYDIFCKLYPFGIRIASLFNRKAKLWVKGRRHLFRHLQEALGQNSQPLLWMHFASLGEFEMGRPVLEAFRQQYPQYRILLTFFSPSGYEIRRDYKGVDDVFYLPADSREHAALFLDICRPSLAIFVKYEFWHYYLQALKARQIPLLLISAVFREDQLFFKPYGDFFRKDLLCFRHFFVQNQQSMALIKSIGLENVTCCGDTRCDRVLAISAQWQPIPGIEQFVGEQPVFVAGSTWPEDEAAFLPFVQQHPGIRFIVAPHEISEDRIKDCLQKFPHAISYSQWEKAAPLHVDAQVLIIDNIGMLSRLYRYATVTYVGGAWGNKGIHNILEAAVFSKPVLYGPNYSKNHEAQELMEAGGAFSYSDPALLCEQLVKLFSDRELLEKSAAAAGSYIRANAGATKVIMQYITDLL